MFSPARISSTCTLRWPLTTTTCRDFMPASMLEASIAEARAKIPRAVEVVGHWTLQSPMIAAMDEPYPVIRVIDLLANALLLTIAAFIALCTFSLWFRGGAACGGPASSAGAEVSMQQQCHIAKYHMHPHSVADSRICNWLCAGLGQSGPQNHPWGSSTVR